MKCIPNLIFISTLIFVSAFTGFAQASSQEPPPPPKPAPSGTIPGGPREIIIEQEFKDDEGNFVLTMPGKPLEMSTTIETPIGKVPIKTFTANYGSISFIAMYAEYPIAIDTPEAIKGGLDAARDMMIGVSNGKLISEIEFAYKQYPGRELKAGTNSDVVRLRMYLVQQRMYLLMVSVQGTTDISRVESKQVGRFLDSFRLIKDPPPTSADVASIARTESAIGDLFPPPEFNNRPVFWREVPWPELGFTIWMPSEPFRKIIPLNPNDQRLDVRLGVARGESAFCWFNLFFPPQPMKQHASSFSK
jgi:hypothetical protein